MKKINKTRNNNQPDSELFGSVTVGAKGQFVIPIEARKKLGIEPGDQLLIFGNDANKVLAVIKSEEVSKLVNDLDILDL